MSLAPEWRLGALSLVDAPFLVAFGADHGSPESSADVLASFLTDGDIEVGGHTGNRTVVIPVLLEGSDLLELAEAEAALIAESMKTQNTLYVYPGDGFAVPFQFTVFGGPGCVVWNRDDVYEQQGYRSFTLTMRALPFAFSATEVITPALPSGTTSVSVADGSSTSGWTASVDGNSVAPSTSGGAVRVTSPTPITLAPVTMTLTSVISTATTKYLMVDWNYSGAGVGLGLQAFGDGLVLPPLSSSASPTSGYTRSWFLVSSSTSSLAAVEFRIDPTASTATIQSLAIDSVARTDIRPLLGSPKQQIRILSVGGSAATTGSLATQHATSSLGEVLQYTCTEDGSGYTPALVGFRAVSVSAVTADPTCVSGGYSDIGAGGSGALYVIPSSTLPNGEYALIARLRSGTGAAQTCGIRTGLRVVMGDTSISGAGFITTTTTVVAPTEYTFVTLAGPTQLHLPYAYTAPGAPSSHAFYFDIGLTGPTDIRLDEVYLLNLTTGDLTFVSCGSGTPTVGGPSRCLWNDSPSVENEGLGNIVRGHSPDRSDAFSAYPSASSVGIHEFPAGPVKVLTVATNPTTSVDVSLRHRRAWVHTAAS